MSVTQLREAILATERESKETEMSKSMYTVQVRDDSRTGLQWEVKLTLVSGPALKGAHLWQREREQRPSYEDVAQDANRVASRLVCLGALVTRGPDFFLDGATRLAAFQVEDDG